MQWRSTKIQAISIVYGVATELPLSGESFDLVICIEVLRYLNRSDIRQSLSEFTAYFGRVAQCF